MRRDFAVSSFAPLFPILDCLSHGDPALCGVRAYHPLCDRKKVVSREAFMYSSVTCRGKCLGVDMLYPRSR